MTQANKRKTPLLLDSTGHGQASGWRRDEDLIDALPYIDPLQPDIKRQVDAMIDAELQNSTKRPLDYLKEMPLMPAPRFEGHPLLASEFERVKAKLPMPTLDAKRLMLDPPAPTKRNDQASWRAAVDNAHAQLEHQHLRILNLELLLKYGANSWRAQAQLSESTIKQYEAELTATRKQIDNVNRERKLQQTAAGNELRKLDVEYMALNHKNAEIEAACCRLEDEVYALRGQLEALATTTTSAPPAAAGGAGPVANGTSSAGGLGAAVVADGGDMAGTSRADVEMAPGGAEDAAAVDVQRQGDGSDEDTTLVGPALPPAGKEAAGDVAREDGVQGEGTSME